MLHLVPAPGKYVHVFDRLTRRSLASCCRPTRVEAAIKESFQLLAPNVVLEWILEALNHLAHAD